VDLTTGGTARPITVMGAPVLANPCAEVTTFDDDLTVLVRDMFASMYAAGGVGLAANQIGVDARVFVIDCPFVRELEGVERLVGHVVNPVLRILDETLVDGGEGCLSVPGPRAELARAARAEVTGLDVHGNPVRLEGPDLAARCLQHETDHLDGRLYLSRLNRREQVRVTEEFQAARLAQSPFGKPVA
jgi:peptide deformylase